MNEGERHDDDNSIEHHDKHVLYGILFFSAIVALNPDSLFGVCLFCRLTIASLTNTSSVVKLDSFIQSLAVQVEKVGKRNHHKI